jgi:hypothetical protein
MEMITNHTGIQVNFGRKRRNPLWVLFWLRYEKKKLHKQGGATEYAAQVLLGKSSGKDMSFFAHSL